MRHAGVPALTELEATFDEVRTIKGLIERKPGIFYRGPVAFLHFHEDPSGVFADAKLNGAAFERMPVRTPAERQALSGAVRGSLASGRKA